MALLLDLHTHSRHSVDARLDPATIVRIARERGLNGVAVTDHMTLRGGLEAVAANDDPRFLVIPGVEYATDVGHIVGLFVSEEPAGLPGPGERPDDLLPHGAVVAAIHASGGIAVLAHPFERRRHLPEGLFTGETAIDAIEGFNSRAGSLRNPTANDQAMAFARAQGIPVVGASDAHHAFEIGLGGSSFEGLAPGASADEVKAAILAGQAQPFGRPGPRTAIPLTQWVKMVGTRRYDRIPKIIIRLALAATGRCGQRLEIALRGESPDE